MSFSSQKGYIFKQIYLFTIDLLVLIQETSVWGTPTLGRSWEP